MSEDGEPIPRPGGVASYRKVLKDLDVEQYFMGHVQLGISPDDIVVSQT